MERPQSEFSDGPPCLESLTQSDIKFDSKVVEYYNKNFEKIFGKPSKQPELFDDLSSTENIEEIVPF